LPLLEHALTLQPENAEARRQLASTHVALKEYRIAIELYRSCLKRDPRDMETLYDLGLVYMNLAQTAFDHVAELPDSAFSALIKASHYADFAEWDQPERTDWSKFAQSEYRRAIGKAPHLPELRARFGNLELKKENWEAAAQLFEQELEVDPYSYLAHYGLAQVFFHRQDIPMTLKHLNGAAMIRPEFFDPPPAFKVSLPREQLNTLYSKILKSGLDDSFGSAFLQAVVAAGIGNSTGESAALSTAKKALADLKTQISAAFEVQTPQEQTEKKGLQLLSRKRYEAGTGLVLPLARKADGSSDLRLCVAWSLLPLKKYDVVGEILDPYVNRNQNDPEPYYLLGLSYQKAATEIMQTMVETDPQSYRLRLLMGDAYFAQERYAVAEKEYQAALNLQPGNSDLYFRLGKAYQSQMKYKEALEHFRRSVESDSRNAHAQLKLGDSLLLARKPEEAVEHLRAALNLDSSLIEAHAKLGKALAMLDRFEDAVGELELASELDRDGSLHYQLGTFYRRLGREGKAAAALKKSQTLREEDLRKQELRTMGAGQTGASEKEGIER
jgi:tetratricopeptide (TPR) repeat protein